MSVWAIIDCEQRSFRTCVCLRSHVIPLVHLTWWIPKDQQHERHWVGQKQTEAEEFHFELQYIQFSGTNDTRCPLFKAFEG